MGKAYPLAIAVFMLSLNLNAEIPVHSEHVYQQGAHQHGLAVITLALEGDQIDVELESPAANIVGFEHVTSTPEQRGLVDKARATLELSNKLFSFIGARCELNALKIDLSPVLDKEDLESEEQEHHGHSSHGDLEHKTHSEISANYQFHCERGFKLTAISLGFLDHFPGIEKLKVVWVTESNQGFTELTAESNTVYLREMP